MMNATLLGKTVLVIALLTAFDCQSFTNSDAPQHRAEKHLRQLLDRWLAGDPPQGALHPELLFAKLMRHDVVACVPEIGGGKDLWFDNAKKDDDVFLLTVNLDAIMKKGNTAAHQVRYRVLVPKDGDCEAKWSAR